MVSVKLEIECILYFSPKNSKRGSTKVEEKMQEEAQEVAHFYHCNVCQIEPLILNSKCHVWKLSSLSFMCSGDFYFLWKKIYIYIYITVVAVFYKVSTLYSH